MVAIKFEPSGFPERDSGLVFWIDHSVEADGANPSGTVAGGEHELTGNACSAGGRFYCESVQVAAPSVPTDDQRSDEDAVTVRYQQRLAVVAQEPSGFILSTGVAGWTGLAVPQINDQRNVVEDCTSDLRHGQQPARRTRSWVAKIGGRIETGRCVETDAT